MKRSSTLREPCEGGFARANAVQAKAPGRGVREREMEPHAGTRRFNDFLARRCGKSCILGPTHSRGLKAARLPRETPRT